MEDKDQTQADEIQADETPDESQDDFAADEALFDALEAEINDWVEEEDLDELEEIEKEFGAAMAEMKREFAKTSIEDIQVRAKEWVREHPVLTVTLAVGAGLLIGGAIAEARRPAPLPKRLKRRSKKLASKSSKYARDVGDTLSDRAALAGGALAATAARAKSSTSSLRKNLEKQAEDASAFVRSQGGRVGKTAEHAYEVAADRAAHAWDIVQHAADDASEAVQDVAKQGFSFIEAITTALKTVFTAVALKKITEWLRKVT